MNKYVNISHSFVDSLVKVRTTVLGMY